MWRRTPRPSRDGEAERTRAPNQTADTSQNKSAHHRHHSALQPPAPHPCASKYTDTSPQPPAAASTPANRSLAARSAYTEQTALRNPALPARKFPASAGPRSSHRRIQRGSAADPNPHFAESGSRAARQRAARRSRMSAHVRRGAGQWAKAPGARDTVQD